MSTFEAVCFAVTWFFILTFGAWSIVEHYTAKIEKKIDKILDYMNTKEQVKAKIEELRAKYAYEGPNPNEKTWTALGDAISIVEELLEKPIPSNIEEAAKEYAKTTFKKPYSDNPDEEVTIVEPDKYAGFIAGAKWDREQMMSKAVEGIARPDDCEIWVNLVGYGYKFNDGDKVRIIIVKED